MPLRKRNHTIEPATTASAFLNPPPLHLKACYLRLIAVLILFCCFSLSPPKGVLVRLGVSQPACDGLRHGPCSTEGWLGALGDFLSFPNGNEPRRFLARSPSRPGYRWTHQGGVGQAYFFCCAFFLCRTSVSRVGLRQAGSSRTFWCLITSPNDCTWPI